MHYICLLSNLKPLNLITNLSKKPPNQKTLRTSQKSPLLKTLRTSKTFPTPNLIPLFVRFVKQVYTINMPRDHFANLYRQTSTRHDSISDHDQFTKDLDTICGMLYSIVTLKCFFPSSPPKMTDDTVSQPKSGDQEYTQIPLW